MNMITTMQELKHRPILIAYLKPLLIYLNDPSLIEINVNQPQELRLESVTNEIKFIKVPTLDFNYWLNLCHVLANGNSLLFDPSNQPRVSVELPGGHRFEAMLGESVKNKLSVSIRLKRNIKLELEAFGLIGQLKQEIIARLQTGANIIISGGTSSGKTTFLNNLLRYVPKSKRILTVEDTYELNVDQLDQVNYLVSRNEANPTINYPQIIDHLVRSRPDLIVCGEISVANAFPILRMLNSGHAGFMCTVHANTPELALSSAIPQNIVMAGIEVLNISELLYQLVDVVIQLQRLDSGKRLVTEILFPKTNHREMVC
jgi:Flp pilus assembly CpaF family ATPase